MLDIHTHLLPAVDDGSRSAEETIKLMGELEKTGFDRFVLSPHFYPYKEPLSEFVRRRDEALAQFCPQSPAEVFYGCECYLHEYLFHAEDITPLCIENTPYLLTELSYRKGDGREMLKLTERLVSTYNITPILAHIERYPYIMKDERFLCEFMELGCLAQVNMISFSDFFVKKKLADYLEKGYVRFLGTDTHREPFDAKSYEKAKEFLVRRFGEDWYEEFGELEQMKVNAVK